MNHQKISSFLVAALSVAFLWIVPSNSYAEVPPGNVYKSLTLACGDNLIVFYNHADTTPVVIGKSVVSVSHITPSDDSRSSALDGTIHSQVIAGFGNNEECDDSGASTPLNFVLGWLGVPVDGVVTQAIVDSLTAVEHGAYKSPTIETPTIYATYYLTSEILGLGVEVGVTRYTLFHSATTAEQYLHQPFAFTNAFATDWGMNNISIQSISDSPVTSPPAPPQTATIDTSVALSGPTKGGNQVTIKGTFSSCKVSNIDVADKSLLTSNWSSVDTSVSMTMPAHEAGKVAIQIYDSCAPLLPALEYTYIAPKVDTQVATAPKRINYIKCSKGNHTRIAHGAKPVCPVGYTQQ